jgi:hypothetical protein
MSNKTPGSIRYQEEDVKHGISAWLIKNGIDVWWEKKNAYGYGVFTAPTGTKKPDLLIRWKDNVVLAEVKNAESCSNVYDSFFQLLGYYNNISTITVDNERLNVTGFIAASQYSIQGHLFPDETLQTYETFGDGRKYAISNGYLPYSEYKMTEMFIRLLWRAKQKPDIFIGALLSSVLNFPSDTPIPSMLAKRNGQQVFKEVRA